MNKRFNPIAIAMTGVLVLLVVAGGLPNALAQGYMQASEIDDGVQASDALASNLLINGDMDQLAFYPRPTNHYVAGQWLQWWANYTAIPEYIDGGHPYHNECYPRAENTLCHDRAAGVNNSSQGYIRWGAPFDAGIYQPVQGTTPCLLYTFEIYNRNDAAYYHPQVAIDPTGWVITTPGNSLPNNCPPDGVTRCPDPYISAFPSTTVWSAEGTHPAYVWAPISVTVEALAETVSVWTRARPDIGGSMSTYWDYGSLTYTPFPENLLPQPPSPNPTGYIQNLASSFDGSNLTITWTTPTPASTQVLYTVESAPISPTVPMTHTTYLPLVAATPVERKADLDPTPVLHHTYTISGLKNGDMVTFVALSRRVGEGACVTETSLPVQVTIETGTLVTLEASASERLWASYAKR
jgi:hypothetical protein